MGYSEKYEILMVLFKTIFGIVLWGSRPADQNLVMLTYQWEYQSQNRKENFKLFFISLTNCANNSEKIEIYRKDNRKNI